MKKNGMHYMVLIVAVVILSIINGACGDSPTTRDITFNTSSFQYICTFGQPANLTKIGGLHGDLPGETRGKMRIVTKKQNNNSFTTLYDATYTNTTAKIDCSANPNGCCVSATVPYNEPYQIIAYYIEYNKIGCSNSNPSLCHAWINSNYLNVYPSAFSPNCFNFSISINNYISTTNC